MKNNNPQVGQEARSDQKCLVISINTLEHTEMKKNEAIP